uniref:Polyketide synthase-nonribosomal peptide synthetase pyiS n=1 Tax=Pyricularia grisea TaxID=148305 RepID=PYIS_PYRGI|nr:RecName: Full=Polyketide synthase-nonribosomal peptide synthetase pyiS; Short=PKS-NRPS pyiS; AltName: Full=Pyrichalasin H biosynthesis cluster protein A; AltName: Full=Pyrichalasin H synthase [Pyricularia grisea]QCS37521.1 PyiS [Pyricularia grisea]
MAATFSEPVAIIGTGCRFPGQCNTPSKLWELLQTPKDLLKEIPENRFSTEAFYHPQNYHHGTCNVRHSYFLEEDLRGFDAQFFGINPVEAHSVDPQQRLLLETVYESLEAAGLSMKEMQGSDTAVYVGVMSADFTDMIGRDPETFPTYFATGTARSILSNRLSFFFDWRGPSMTIDTACSSSLIEPRTGANKPDCAEQVAGSNLILGSEQYIAESKLQMLSPTGRSRMWDADADGYARGEGVAAIVLKKLSQAIADGDHIECIIRETGANQDGRTPGITMPSATAQEALIRTTYKKAGLDISKRSDRPQFFEAHGTGTPAGDPIEARAVSNAFFGPRSHFSPTSPDDTLFVGSIKTVVGHTEGTAGLAAVIKASLALQAGVVPPNMHLSKLNPKIEPFYGNVQILSEARQWPKLAEGGVRRVSVNSFGFGGANCHAILEAYEPESTLDRRRYNKRTGKCFTPFLFSAATENALAAQLDKYRAHVACGNASAPGDLKKLSLTLSNRRSALPWRAVVPASNSVERLIENLDQCNDFTNETSASSLGTRPRILGIFTGQGAQWPRMGAALIESSPAAAKILARLDESLRLLPIRDRPTWSLREKILEGAESSSVAMAFISQPVCAAVQIMLVDMLRAAGIEFSGVLGHSSGEISAAYAAGYLSSEDAIRAAYYRGFHMKSLTQKKGAMIAVGTSYDDAKELCDLPAFEGRVCVAASNSPFSVTLSGDADAIDEVKALMDEEKKFNRLLQVDRAYHSHHMKACAAAYMASLQQCGVRTLTRTAASSRCQWVSSVYVRHSAELAAEGGLEAKYWASNLTMPVMFTEALQKLLGDCKDGKAYDLAIEVGPHPALKGPAVQTMSEFLGGQSIPYTGVLSRGKDDVESFSTTLGYIWRTLGEGAVDFLGYSRFMNEEQGEATITPLNGLPTYPWDHHRKFWHESRLSRAYRFNKDPVNELLGRQILDGAPDQLRWRNVLKRNELDWLDGHQVQRQTVFPFMGYVSACVEAAMKIRGDANVQSIELQNFKVGQAVAFNDDDSWIEILVVLDSIKESKVKGTKTISAHFAFHSSSNNETVDMTTHAGCDVLVTYGDSISDLLPPPEIQADDEYFMLGVESDRFYNVLDDIGLGYTGPFRALSGLQRKLGKATGRIKNPASSKLWRKPLLVHPAMLDAGIQSIMLAYCYPGDTMMRSIYLPTGIRRLIINPEHCQTFAGEETDVLFQSSASVDDPQGLSGDVSIYAPGGLSCKAIQVEGLQTQPLFNPTEANDLNIFTELVWGVDRPDAKEIVNKVDVQQLDGDLLFSLERVAYYYLRILDKSIPLSQRTGIDWHFGQLFAYVDHVLSRVERGTNRFARKEWQHDTKEIILEILERYPDNIDLRLMRAVGENIAAVIRGEITMLEPMLQNNMLNDFYVVAHGMPRYTKYLASLASQIGHRYPHMHVLEIGAGTGGATKSFLGALDDKFSTYTFTDISSGFFEKARSVFASYSAKMSFKMLNIEKDIGDQGFVEGSYDVVIASLVLHATRNLGQTLRNVRRLLKPGGYLLLLEITENDQMRFGLLFGGLEGWWLGYDDGRALSPCINIEEWEKYLKQTGFSGIDTLMPHDEILPVPLSVIVSQAVDERTELLKQPLQRLDPSTTLVPQLTIIGSGALAEEVHRLLRPFCGRVNVIESLGHMGADQLPVGGAVICLADIQEPVFKSMDADKLRGFQTIFKQSGSALWVTQGTLNGNPYSRMVIGFGRTIVLEMLHLRLQFLDLDHEAPADPTAIVETFIRLHLAENWKNDGVKITPLLHSVEPEMHIDKEGRGFIPRFKLNKKQNDRYNSGRRKIVKEVPLRQQPVELVPPKSEDASWLLAEGKNMPELKGAIDIDVFYTVTRAVEVSGGTFLYAVLGARRDTKEVVLALSPTQASIIRVPQAFIIPAQDSVEYLQLFYTELLARAVLRDVAAGTVVVVLRPTSMLSCAVDRLAADRGARVLHLADEPGSDWDYLHHKSSKVQVQDWVKSRLGTEAPPAVLLLDFGADQFLLAYLLECLPAEVTRAMVGAQSTSSKARMKLGQSEQEIRSFLADVRYALLPAQQTHQSSKGRSSLKVFTLEHLTTNRAGSDVSVVSWPAGTSTIPVQVQPVNSKVTFSNDKTYWLVGLSGTLGLSLCEWMAQQGARYIVITSRNPNVDERWKNKMEKLGIKVEIIANNICDRKSVRSVYSHICQTMPPIGGVAQGAMVLHDTAFSELDLERINKVMQPKVNGSIYLEEIFHNTPLEFFVFFSSMACVTGNPGQSAYAAANMFMSGLAVQRRKRGLNASVVHIGAIFGNGYVTRELSLEQQNFLRKVGNMWLSEQDFRQLFAEAVLAGQPENTGSPELSTGMMTIDNSEGTKENITWFDNPMFQHCIKESTDGKLGGQTAKGRAVPVKTQLLEAINSAEVYEIIHDAFAAKLRSSLQLEDDRPIVDQTADTLGIDSLFAVDIRSWFIKELQLEIPVLKILGGATVGEILETAQQLLPMELLPKMDPNDKSPARKLKAQPDSSPDKAASAERSRAKAQTAIENDGDRKFAATRAESGAKKGETVSKKVEAVTRPSVQWQVPVEPSTAVGDLDDKSFPGEDGVRLRAGSLDTTFTHKSSASSSASILDASEDQSADSVWSLDTVNNELAVSKKTPISFAQSRIWFLEKFLEDPASALNITLTIELDGSLDVDRFGKAVKLVGQRHEALRTRFVHGDDFDAPMQEVLVHSTLSLEQQDIASDAEADEVYRELQKYRYKLGEGENMRIILLKKSNQLFHLVIGYHHINMDGVSLEVVLRELQMAYDSKRLPNFGTILQYPDFAALQQKEYKSGAWQDEIEFWRKEFDGRPPSVLPLLPMAKTRSRTALTSYSSHTAEFSLDQITLAGIQSACESSKATPFQFHLATFYALLSRMVDAADICIGIGSANRHDTAMMQSVGIYLNLLPIVLKSQPNETFASTLKRVRSKVMTAFAHSRVPFDVIVNELGASRATTHNPLFQVLVNYRQGTATRRSFCGCQSEVRSFEQGQAAYDLGLDIIENPGGECKVIMTGQSTLFVPEDMDMLKDMYQRLLLAFSRNQALRLAIPSLYDPEMVKHALRIGRGPSYTHKWPETLIHQIDDIAKQKSHSLAIVDGSGTFLTYAHMSRRTNAIAASLRGIRRGSRVGVHLDPGADWVCSVLAIMRRDAVYLPLDAVSGYSRLSAILQDSKPDLVLVDNSTEKDATAYFSPILAADQIFNIDTVSVTPPETLAIAAKRGSVAALMYTSGSTGVPKGIIMKHESFRNNIEIISEKLGYNNGHTVTLQQSSFNFDMSLGQIFLALSTGGTLHVVPRHLRADPVAISSIIALHGITNTSATPSEFISWVRYGSVEELRNSAWAAVHSGGEPVRDSLKAAFLTVNKPGLRLLDCYGPTEVTFCSHISDVDYGAEETSMNKGLEVLPNYATYIVDSGMKPVPAGVPGEVLIGGAGVVAGYLHTELNTRGFAHDSFASDEFRKQGWEQLHRTGDFGRINKLNGRLLLEGRIADDTQVKLRGLRIDLKEIEAAMVRAAKGDILDCIVSVAQSADVSDEYLVAYATARPDASNHRLEHLMHQLPLPQYMKPATLVLLEKMPTNASGKIDRSAFKSIPLPKATEDNGMQPEVGQDLNDTESRLKQLWEGVLPKHVFSQHKFTAASDFFNVGGSSMLLISLRAKIQDTFAVVVSLFQLFEASTLGDMAALVDELSSGSAEKTAGPNSALDINWEDETAVSPALLGIPVEKKFFTNPEIVVLTGSTGFLGRAILTRLLNDGIVKEIHCFAVREEIPLFDSPKIIVHRGDLTLPGFGLSQKELASIFSKAHAVIHNGADVSFVKSYHSLKPANLEATKQLVDLCLPYQISFHYISTAAVVNLTGEKSWEQRSVGRFPPPAGTDGYIATKWASERYLEKFNDQYGLPIWIHRPSSITGPGAPANDLMANVVEFSRSTAATLNTNSWSGWLDFISVDEAALQIVDEVYEDYSWPGHVKYLYESGERVVALEDMKNVLEREVGSVFEVVDVEEWISRAEKQGFNPLLGEYLKRVANAPLVFPKLIRHEGFF